jgi:hypothetical protein
LALLQRGNLLIHLSSASAASCAQAEYAPDFSDTEESGHGGLLLNSGSRRRAERLSEGQPDKWEVVGNQGMYDFVANGFELKSVAYDTSVLGPQSDSPDVHYFLQKRHDLVRYDSRKRDQTSYYWCYKLVKARAPQ